MRSRFDTVRTSSFDEVFACYQSINRLARRGIVSPQDLHKKLWLPTVYRQIAGSSLTLRLHRAHRRRRCRGRHGRGGLRSRSERRRAGYDSPRENDADKPAIHGIGSFLLAAKGISGGGTRQAAA